MFISNVLNCKFVVKKMAVLGWPSDAFGTRLEQLPEYRPK
jgi:hypothetical protein